MLKCYWAQTALLEKPEVFDFWLEKVNTQRKEKVLRCKNLKDKQRSLLAGVILRHALEAEGLSCETLEFAVAEEGKPMVLSLPQVHFNMSHAGDYVCCVISDQPVGVDMETLEKSIFYPEKENRMFSMAKKTLSDAEWQNFEKSPEKARTFLEYWTKKEAYSKFTGKGLREEFSDIDTEEKQYWTNWIVDGYCLSIYKENENYEELFIKQVGKEYV